MIRGNTATNTTFAFIIDPTGSQNCRILIESHATILVTNFFAFHVADSVVMSNLPRFYLLYVCYKCLKLIF